MNFTAEATIREAAEEVIRSARMPGMVIAIAQGTDQPETISIGTDANERMLEQDSLFPVASVTKLATALAVLRLIDAGEVALNDLLRDHLPYAAAAQADVTMTQLLCHTSGLPPEIDEGAAPYAEGLDWEALGHACLETALESEPDTRVQYSNVGYGLLALVVERHTGQRFAESLHSLVIEPLGIEAYLGSEPPRPVVTLSDVRSEHVGTPLEPFNSPFWRSLALPWAGLVTTARGALELARAFTHGTLLCEETRAVAVRNQAGTLAGGFRPPMMWDPCPWGLGPELRGTKTPHWTPEQVSADSFGHSGASGCLAWSDPTADCTWALVGSRTADSGWLLRRAPAISAAIVAGSG